MPPPNDRTRPPSAPAAGGAAPGDARDGAPGREGVAQLFEKLFDHSPDGVLVTRPDGTIVRANAAACRMLGRSEAEIRQLGRGGLVVDDEGFRAFIHERARNGVAHGEVVHRRRDGSTYPAELTSAIVPGTDGELHAVVVFRDVTHGKRAEEALRRYELLASRTRDVILFVRRADGRILEANAAATAVYGYTVEELQARTVMDLRVGGADPELEAHMRLADAGGVLFETVHRRKDGTSFPVEVSSEGATLGGVRVLVSVVRDISARKAAEDALRESDRRKSEFLAMLSHELRNPLAPILNGVELLRRVGPLPAQADHARAVIERQSRHLACLVDDLLDVTRISRGKFELERARLELRELLRRIVEDHRDLFASREVSLTLSVPGAPVYVDADATRVAQAIGNLLQNAVKFTPRGGSTWASVRARDGEVEIAIRDDGVGISPDVIPRVFEPFVQGERSLARSQGGLGLGLALVKGIAELHGGRVRARSDGPGRGAEIVVVLPAGAAAAPAPAVARDAPVARRRPATILIVEDNPDAAESLGEVLALEGHRVEIAPDGRSGIAVARARPPEFVVCDLGLPDVDGYEVARTLRADPALRAVRLIALSGYAQPEDRERARAAGFDLHFAKPAPLEALLAALATPP